MTRATRREWIGLAVIALPCLLYAMDLTVLNLALPEISADLKPSGTQLLWIVDIYGFLVAGALIPMGALGDRIGRRKLLMCGAAAFGAASIAAAFSKSAGMLIATRAVLGLAGATLAPSTLSLIRNMFLDEKERTFAIGIWITSYSVGGALGPLLGGALLAHFWWGSVFLLSVPVMALLLMTAPWLLPEYRDPTARLPDVPSALLSLAAVLAIIFGVKRIAVDGLQGLPLTAIAAGFLIGAVFVRRQKKLADPLIDLRLFRAPIFSAALVVYTLATAAIFGIFIFIAQYLELVLAFSPLRSGVCMLPIFGGFIIGSLLTPVITRRIRGTSLVAGGLLLAAVGFGLLTQLGGRFNPAILLTAFGLYALGMAPVFTLATDFIVGSAPPERAGAAAALSETGSEFGGALGVAILGSAGLACYRRGLPGAVLQALAPSAREAARNTLGGALAAAAQLPPELGAPLRAAARATFTQTLHLVAALDVALVVATAVIATVLVFGTQRATQR